MKPRRMQLSRRRGFSLQAESKALNGLPAKRVTRPGPWGNPFTIEETAARYGIERSAQPGAAKRHRALRTYGPRSRGTILPAGVRRERPAMPTH